MGLPLGNLDLRSNTDTHWAADVGVRLGARRIGTSVRGFRLCLLGRWLLHSSDTFQDVDRQLVRKQKPLQYESEGR
jgi:hypothetical protein